MHQDRAIHDWYQFVWGYSDHLVSGLLDEFAIHKGDQILDPFCGTGTTLVECLKRGIDCIGVDANPASLFVSRVKTRLRLNPVKLVHYLDVALSKAAGNQVNQMLSTDPTLTYLRESGMIKRRWIGAGAARRALAIKQGIARTGASAPYREALTLALIDTVVRDASNVRFGPELYVGPSRTRVDITDGFASRVIGMAADLSYAEYSTGSASVIRGDARRIRVALRRFPEGSISGLICSPPYPAEHDYTRNARLELAFLEMLNGDGALRAIKRTMIVSHTKGVYAADRDWRYVWIHPKVARLAQEVEERSRDRTHGFARLYSTVIVSYFGGMLRHFQSVRRLMKPGSKLAYVVSDQASYANVKIPTAKILGDLAEWAGFEMLEIRHWRRRRASVTARKIDENILILKA